MRLHSPHAVWEPIFAALRRSRLPPLEQKVLRFCGHSAEWPQNLNTLSNPGGSSFI